MEQIHWYPGHMAKAKKQLIELMKLLDIILEVRDARAPASSHNNDLEPLLQRRPYLIILNKSDLADPNATADWLKSFKTGGLNAVVLNARDGKGINEVWDNISRMLAPKQLKRAGRVGVIGIPNAGKSSVLNRLLGTGSAKTGNLPGITRGKQWVKRNGLEILDTPGLLPPKIASDADGRTLALLGTIREDIIPVYDLALILLEKYGAKLFVDKDSYDASGSAETQLEWYAGLRGFLVKGGAPDLNRAATTLLKEFRDGKMGRITLEPPPAAPVSPAAPVASSGPVAD
jgi:ribosome biogenesis GTPase A